MLTPAISSGVSCYLLSLAYSFFPWDLTLFTFNILCPSLFVKNKLNSFILLSSLFDASSHHLSFLLLYYLNRFISCFPYFAMFLLTTYKLVFIFTFIKLFSHRFPRIVLTSFSISSDSGFVNHRCLFKALLPLGPYC